LFSGTIWYKHGLPAPSSKSPFYNKFLEILCTLENTGLSFSRQCKCKIEIKNGDLLSARQKYKVQAIAADLWCSKGIAGSISKLYKKKPKHPNPQIGNVLPMQVTRNSTFLNVITKKRSFHKIWHDPENFILGVQLGIKGLANYCIKNKITEIAMPNMCSGLDKVPKLYIQHLLLVSFHDYDIQIYVYQG